MNVVKDGSKLSKKVSACGPMAQECGSLNLIIYAAIFVYCTLSPRLMQRQRIMIWLPNITQTSG